MWREDLSLLDCEAVPSARLTHRMLRFKGRFATRRG